jgi:limonene-1,2-epoxide hydrolase
VPDATPIVTRCLKAWTSGDFDTARSLIDDGISFAGPFGTAQGAEAYISGLRRFRQRGIRSAEVQKIFCDGGDVCVIYDILTSTAAGDVPAAGWYQVREGKISSVRVFFDARPLV